MELIPEYISDPGDGIEGRLHKSLDTKSGNPPQQVSRDLCKRPSDA